MTEKEYNPVENDLMARQDAIALILDHYQRWDGRGPDEINDSMIQVINKADKTGLASFIEGLEEIKTRKLGQIDIEIERRNTTDGTLSKLSDEADKLDEVIDILEQLHSRLSA